MTISTKQLLHFLPIEEGVRNAILSQYDAMTPSQQWEVSKTCKLMYRELFKSAIDVELQKAIDPQNENAILSNDLYQEIEKKVHQDFMGKIERSEQVTGLDEVRQKLQSYMKAP